MEMAKRIITGVALIVISVALILHSKWAMALLIFPIGIMGMKEFYQLALFKGIKPSYVNGVISVIILYLSALTLPIDFSIPVLTALLLITMCVFVIRKDNHVSALIDSAVTILGYIYIGWFFSMLFYLRDVPGTITAYGFTIDQGAAMALLLVLTNCFTDIGSFFFGKFLGKTKLCPHISPNKTVEGAIGGIFTGIIIALIAGRLLTLSFVDSMWFGLIISLTAQMGDLWESVLKRDVEVKDSGASLPGHGGILDRFDSLFLSAPTACFLFYYFIGF